MRALLVVEGRAVDRSSEAIASALRARGYETAVQSTTRTFDRDVHAADLLVVGFGLERLLRGRLPAALRDWIVRAPKLEHTPTAVFCTGRGGAEHAIAAAADAVAQRGAAVLAVRVFAPSAPTNGVVPFTEAFLEAVADRRGT